MLELKVKYFSEDIPRLKPSIKEDGNEWIDVYAAEDVIIELGERKLIPLGFALEMPKGYEAVLAARSSTNGTWGIILVNGFGVIDNKYKGNEDDWKVNVMFINPNCKSTVDIIITDPEHPENVTGIKKATKISKGDKIGQFRIQECMPDVKFVEVDNLDNEDRGGFGSTGTTGYNN